jgi:hypothetical protein
MTVCTGTGLLVSLLKSMRKNTKHIRISQNIAKIETLLTTAQQSMPNIINHKESNLK